MNHSERLGFLLLFHAAFRATFLPGVGKELPEQNRPRLGCGRPHPGCELNSERVHQAFHHPPPDSSLVPRSAGTAAAWLPFSCKECRTAMTHAAQMGRIPTTNY